MDFLIKRYIPKAEFPTNNKTIKIEKDLWVQPLTNPHHVN